MIGKAILKAGKLSKAQQRIADYLTMNEHAIPYMTEPDIAGAAGVSVATVSRFWEAIGFQSLKDVKNTMKTEIAAPPAAKLKGKLSRISEHHVAGRMFAMEMQHLQQTAERLSPDQFDRAADWIARADRVFVYGTGPSAALCELLAFRLNRFGISVVRVAPAGNDMFEHLVHMTARDCLVVFGFFGYPNEVAVALSCAREAGSRIILISDMLVSDLNSAADVMLYAYRGERKEFHSMVAPVAMIDSLVVAVARLEDGQALESLNRLYHLRNRHLSPSKGGSRPG